MDIDLDESAETVVHHWIVTGEPGPIGDPALNNGRFPSYRHVWSSADSRWLGDKAEASARRFVETILAEPVWPGGWESGPFLHHRTVTYGPLEPIGAGPPATPAAQPAAGGLLCKCMNLDCPNPHYDQRPAGA